MKRLFLGFIGMIAMLSAASAQENMLRLLLTETEKQMNAMAPMETPMGTVTKADLNGDVLEIDMTLNDLYSQIAQEKLESFSVLFDSKMAAITFLTPIVDGGFVSYEDVKSSGMSLFYRYWTTNGKMVADMTITPSDMLAAFVRLDSKSDALPLNDRQFYIDYNIASTAPFCPMEVEEGLILSKAEASSNGPVFVYTFTNIASGDIDATPEFVAEMREVLVTDLKTLSQYNPFLYEDMAKCGIVYTYVYNGNDGKEILRVDVPVADVFE